MKFRAFIFFLVCLGLHADATILHVGNSHDFLNLKDAIASAAAYDTVMVHGGYYNEGNIVISKPLILLGIGRPVLDGKETFEIISVNADNTRIEGFELRNSGKSSTTDYAAIKLYDLSGAVITNNLIENSFFGVYAQNSHNCEISLNIIRAYESTEQRSANGIHCWKCSEMKIIANEIQGHRDGIYFEFVTYSIIWRNRSHDNKRYGLHFMFSNHDTYVANIFQLNGAGVAVMYSNHVSMFSNIFRHNWGDASFGILLKEISDSHIEGNYFEKNTSGIFMEGASRVNMFRNSFDGNGWGLKIQSSCMEIVLRNNDFINNTFDVGSNGTLMLNTFEYNYWDKYTGYDLNKDGTGDVPYRPVSLFSMIIERDPNATILFRSLVSEILDQSEKILPTITPEKLKDGMPKMKRNTV